MTSSRYFSFSLGAISLISSVEVGVAFLTVAHLAAVRQDAVSHPHRLVAGGAERSHVRQGEGRFALDDAARTLGAARAHVALNDVDARDDDPVLLGYDDAHGTAAAAVL